MACLRGYIVVVNTFKTSTAERVPSECNQPRYTCDMLEYLFKSTFERVPSECSKSRYIGDIFLHLYFKNRPKAKTKNTSHIVRLSLSNSCIVTVSPDMPSLLLLNTLSTWESVAGTQRYFLASFTKVRKPSFLDLHQSRHSCPQQEEESPF